MTNTTQDQPELRQPFHDWLESEGFARPATPEPGRAYRGSHIDLLWHCYVYATLTERAKHQGN